VGVVEGPPTVLSTTEVVGPLVVVGVGRVKVGAEVRMEMEVEMEVEVESGADTDGLVAEVIVVDWAGGKRELIIVTEPVVIGGLGVLEICIEIDSELVLALVGVAPIDVPEPLDVGTVPLLAMEVTPSHKALRTLLRAF